jgi:MoxR-like ATPase
MPAQADHVERIGDDVIGRERELELILAAVDTGRDLLLEGPPGTSKTTLLKAVTAAWGIPLILAEGSAELTPGRLLGHHDPARALREGYTEDTFRPGPLVEAMTRGGFFYLEEFNRAPEDTLNALLTAISDHQVTIPRAGTFVAAPSFRVIGSMNPYDNVGTTRLSVSITDRLCRLEIGYQDVAAERQVVARRAAVDTEDELAGTVIDDAVAVTRKTRSHEATLQGSSVRGAIDLTLMATHLCAARDIEEPDSERYTEAFWDVMMVALSGRIRVDESLGRGATTILREIWEEHFFVDGALAAPGDRAVDLPDPPPFERHRDSPGASKRGSRRRPKQLDQDPSLAAGANGEGLASGTPHDASGKPRDRRPSAGGTTSDDGGLDDPEGEPAADAAVRAAAGAIAARLALVRPAPMRPRRSAAGEAVLLPYDGSDDSIELDATVERLISEPEAADGAVMVQQRRRQRRALVLAVDVSGSMRDERLRTVAATVGALGAEFARDELALFAFWSDAAALLRLGEHARPDRLIDEIMGLRAAGLTNISFPLELAGEELRSASSDCEPRVLLLSDCVHNAGPDPRGAANRLPRLDVLFDDSAESDPEMARDLARIGRGAAVAVRDHHGVASALERLLT